MDADDWRRKTRTVQNKASSGLGTRRNWRRKYGRQASTAGGNSSCSASFVTFPMKSVVHFPSDSPGSPHLRAQSSESRSPEVAGLLGSIALLGAQTERQKKAQRFACLRKAFSGSACAARLCCGPPTHSRAPRAAHNVVFWRLLRFAPHGLLDLSSYVVTAQVSSLRLSAAYSVEPPGSFRILFTCPNLIKNAAAAGNAQERRIVLEVPNPVASTPVAAIPTILPTQNAD